MKYNTSLYILALILVFAVCHTSCKKLLEEEPKAIASLGDLDPTTLEQTIIGMYEPLTRSRGRLWESTVGLGLELMSEYADGGSSQAAWSNYNNLNSPTTFNATWTTLYEGIGRANMLIANLDANTTLNDSIKKSAYGEAYFVRAYCYYFAVRVWGKVPMRLKPILNSSDVALPLSEITGIYNQVITDLKFAETALPAKVASTKAGRATAGAAKVALADVYLTLGQYQNARDKAKEVLDNKSVYGYDLEPSLATLYSPTLPTNKEDVFSLKFAQVRAQGTFMASYWADSRAKDAGFSVRGNKFGGIISVAPLIKNWDTNDLRRKFSLYNSYYIRGVLTAAEVEKDIYDLRMGKYKDPDAPEDTGNGNDFYLFRFADVLLIFAEAENKVNGATAAAYDAINQVRRRAFGQPTGTPGTIADLQAGLSQSQFDDSVFRERGYEFIGEAKRWFDLVRTNRVAQMINEVSSVIKFPARKPVPTKTLFLIPDVELQNNPAIK